MVRDIAGDYAARRLQVDDLERERMDKKLTLKNVGGHQVMVNRVTGDRVVVKPKVIHRDRATGKKTAGDDWKCGVCSKLNSREEPDQNLRAKFSTEKCYLCARGRGNNLRDAKHAWEEVLPKLLMNDPSITELDLSDRKLNDNDVEKLCHMMQNNTTVTTLDLRRNLIGDSGLGPLCKMLKAEKVPIKNLNLQHNRFGSAGGELLKQALKSNYTCTWLELYGCNITEKPTLVMEHGLKTKHEVTTLELFHNKKPAMISSLQKKGLALKETAKSKISKMGFMKKKVNPDSDGALVNVGAKEEEKPNKFMSELGEWIPTRSYRIIRKTKGQ
jgi:hypothetical protein